MKKKLIGFSLWGNNPIYTIGAIRNAELSKVYFPDWELMFIVGKSVPQNIQEKLIELDCLVIKTDKEEDFTGMFWRFWAAEDIDVDIFLSRDCDSRFSDREFTAINEWLNSDKDFHIMRDHPYHPWPILTGMWGCRNNRLSNIDDLLLKWETHSRKGIYQAEDQDFLGQFIYPMTINNSVEHSEFGIRVASATKPFPTPRNNYEFVGDVFDVNNNRHPDYWRVIERNNKNK